MLRKPINKATLPTARDKIVICSLAMLMTFSKITIKIKYIKPEKKTKIVPINNILLRDLT